MIHTKYPVSAAFLFLVVLLILPLNSGSAQGGTIWVRSTPTQSDTLLPPERQRQEFDMLMEQMRALRLITSEMEKLVAEMEALGGIQTKGGASINMRAPVMQSLQQHARSAVITIQRLCSNSAQHTPIGYIGVRLQESDSRALQRARSATPVAYPRVVSVDASSPASLAGLLSGDEIVSVGGVDLRGRQLAQFVSTPGDTLYFSVRRGSREFTTRVQLGTPPQAVDQTCEFIVSSPDVVTLLRHDSVMATRFKLAPLTVIADSGVMAFRGMASVAPTPRSSELRTYFGAQFFNTSPEQLERWGATRGGAAVLSIQPNSVAARAGLQRMDVVTRVGRFNVSSVGELRSAIDSSAAGDVFELEVMRSGKQIKLKIDLRRER